MTSNFRLIIHDVNGHTRDFCKTNPSSLPQQDISVQFLSKAPEGKRWRQSRSNPRGVDQRQSGCSL